MKKSFQAILVIAILLIVILLIFLYLINHSKEEEKITIPDDNTISNENKQSNNTNLLFLPLDKVLERVTKKPFGIFITQENSPISPERFSGYHTGVDFEIFSEEEIINVGVLAVCSGPLIYKGNVNGYGGVAIQKCDLAWQIVTVIYGHLKLASLSAEIQEQLTAGSQFAVLGEVYSQETDFERKHLHLGIHQGEDINFLGYVDSLIELKDWLDPLPYLIDS